MRVFRAVLPLIVAVAFFALPASAGTKYQASLVPTSDAPAGLSTKSKVVLKSNGQVKVTLKGVNGGGGLVSTDQSLRQGGMLTGDEYVTVLHGTFVALGISLELNLVAELKKGKGVAKADASSLFNLVPPNVVRAIEVTGATVYGPLGQANVAGCQANLGLGGLVFEPTPNPCIGGSQVGVAGIMVP
jgi:hypothetical protein